MLLSNQNMPDLQRFERAGDKVQALYEYVYMMHQEINHVLSNLDEKNLGKSLAQTIQGMQQKLSDETQTIVKQEEQTAEEEQQEPKLTIDDVYPVGSVYVSAKNANPGETLGGTWVLVDKEFTPQSISGEDVFAINTTNVSSLENAFCILSGHTVHLRIVLKNKVALADESKQLGSVLFENIGVKEFDLQFYGLAPCDGLNGSCYFTLNRTTGVLTHGDLLGSSSTSTGQTIYFHVLQNIRHGAMIDSFCNKFYWKRTA